VLGLLLTLKGGIINKCSKCANFFQEAFSFFLSFFMVFVHDSHLLISSKKNSVIKICLIKHQLKFVKSFFAIVLVAFYTEFWTQFQKLC